MVDLDSSPTKLIDIVRIGKQLLITRGSLTAFSVANAVAMFIIIIPRLLAENHPELSVLNLMNLYSLQSAVLSAIVYNAFIIPACIPLALKGVSFRKASPGSLLAGNLSVYGLGGLILPIVFMKLFDLLIVGAGLV